MGAVANNLALPANFLAPNGQTYKVSPWTYEVQGIYERYLESRAAQAVERLRPHLSPDAFDRALAGLSRDVALGIYSFGTDECSKSLQSPEHVQHAFWLCVNFYHREVMRADVAAWGKTHYGAMVRAMNEANADPNSNPPEGSTPTPSAISPAS